MTEKENDQPEGEARKEQIKAQRMARRGSDPEWAEIGKRLKAIRQSKGMTQGDVAALFSIKNGQSHISAHENGTIALGRHTRKNYIILLGVNPEYIDHGTLPMFLPPDKQRKTTADQVIAAIHENRGGNLRVVLPRFMGQFLNTGHVDAYQYPYFSSDCWAFPVDSPDMGPDFPLGAFVICSRVYNPSSLLTSRAYAFQTADEVAVRYFGGYDAEYGAYKLNTATGPDRVIDIKEIEFVYHIERIDRPVL